MAKGDIRIGISGWRYEPWRGVFYPVGLPQRRELEYASRMLPTIEINGSFYSLQSPAFYSEWHDDTPADFVFAVKGPKYITHMRRLKEIETPLANFFATWPPGWQAPSPRRRARASGCASLNRRQRQGVERRIGNATGRRDNRPP